MNMHERQMREGFNLPGTETLAERPQEVTASARSKAEREQDREDDTRMVPMKKLKQDDFTNRKVREFMRLQEKQLRKKIEHHNLNLNNVHVGNTTAKDDLEDMDLNADVVDERIEKQIAKRLNEQLTTVKKGSEQY